MRLVADESVDMEVVRGLLAAGYDVLAIADLEPSMPDESVFALAVSEKRLLLTEDRDFGRFLKLDELPGAILLRFQARTPAAVVQAVVDLLVGYGNRSLGQFVVLEPGRIRFHRP